MKVGSEVCTDKQAEANRRSVASEPVETAVNTAAQPEPPSFKSRKRRRLSEDRSSRKHMRATRRLSNYDEERVTEDEEETQSSHGESPGSDLDASEELSWEEIQKNSLMIDLDLRDDDEDDPDYTEDMTDTELTIPLTTPSLLIDDIPSIRVRFIVPITLLKKEFVEFPISVVRDMVERFNRDYLMRRDWRRTYQKMLEERDYYVHKSACVRQLLNEKGKKQQTTSVRRRTACDACVAGRTLCVGLKSSFGYLEVYPLPDALRKDVDWREMNFWVRK
jgi:hypothetical protein